MIHWTHPHAPLLGDHVDIWRIDLIPSVQTLDVVRPWLSVDEINRARRFRFDRDRIRYIIGRGALRQIIGTYLELEPHAVAIAYGEYQKPILDGKQLLHFNLSNSHEMALLAVSQRGPVGVDVEYLGRPIEDVIDLAETVFSPDEQVELKQAEPAVRHDTFLRGWTRKEAYLKGIGKGLMVPLQDFSVSLHESERPDSSLPHWHFLSFRPNADYLAALATPFSASTVQFWKWSA